MTLGEYEKQLHTKGDSYKQMVLALRAFANEVLFDDSSRAAVTTGAVRCGRKMTTSARNRRAPGVDVTPDLIVQQSPTYGVVAECKWGVSRDTGLFAKHVQETVEQLEKYDDDLTGWPLHPKGNGTLANHDLALLVNHEDSRRVKKELIDRRPGQQGAMRIDRNFAIVGIVQIKRAEGAWPELDLEYGKLSNARKTEKLDNRVQIDPAKLAYNPLIALVELADVQPPAPVMMELVHRAVVENLSLDAHEQHRLEGEVRKEVSLEELCQWTAKFSFERGDDRDCECPQREWIIEAMSKLERMKWAQKVDGRKNRWVYIHKKGRKDPYRRFIKFCAREAVRAEVRTRKAMARHEQAEAREHKKEKEKANRRREREEQRKTKQLAKAKEKNPLFAKQIEKDAQNGALDRWR